MKAEAVLKCPECGSTRIFRDYESGEDVCTNCGLVIEELMLDSDPEWRSFTAEEREHRSRIGMPAQLSINNKGLSTTITSIEYDAFGRRVSPSTRLQMRRLRRWQIRSRVHASKERNLAQAMAELDRLCDQLQIPQFIKESAAVIYRKALERNLIRGRSIAAFAAGALYAACRIGNVPRNLREVVEACVGWREDRVCSKGVMRCYRLIVKELGLNMPVPDAVSRVSKIAETLGISGEIQGRAVQMLRLAREKRESFGKEPVGLAAAALYIACQAAGEDVTQKQIADVAGVTEVTVRNRCKSLMRCLGMEVSPRKHAFKRRPKPFEGSF